MFVPLLGTFLVNSLPILVLYDSGASRYFVSRSFGRQFRFPLRELECLLRVSIANEHGVSISIVYQGCILEIFMVPFPID